MNGIQQKHWEIVQQEVSNEDVHRVWLYICHIQSKNTNGIIQIISSINILLKSSKEVWILLSGDISKEHLGLLSDNYNTNPI